MCDFYSNEIKDDLKKYLSNNILPVKYAYTRISLDTCFGKITPNLLLMFPP